jgi:hypothetical protein
MTTNTSAPPTRLYAHVVLDRSGSMRSCADDAVGGYNSYVAQLPATARVSLTLFDTGGIDLVRDAREPAAASLAIGEFQPRASTPLYDAIGHTVAEIEKRCAGFDRVALVFLTDGFENASTRFKRDDILKLLKEKQERDGWLVIYLGANQDAWKVGEQFGTVADNSMSVDPGQFGVALHAASYATTSYTESSDRQSGRALSGFSREDRARAKRPRN